MKSVLFVPVLFLSFFIYGQCPSSGTTVNLTGTITITSADSPCNFSAGEVTSDATIVIEQGASMTVTMTGSGTSLFDQLGGSITVDGDGIGGDEGVFTIAGSGDFSLEGATLNIGAGAVVNVGNNMFQGSFLTSTLNIDGILNVGNNYNLGSESVITGSGHIDVDGILSDGGVDQSGFTGTSECGDGCSSLPVTMTSFDLIAQSDAVRLEWVTSAEINNEGFEVQKSYDGNSFETIAFVEGNGTTNSQSSYEYTDFKLESNIIYYRLQQFDYDGNYEFTETKKIQINNSGVEAPKMLLYPSHVTHNKLKISNYDQDSQYVAALMDMSGRQYYVSSSPQDMSSIEQEINSLLHSLPGSLYLIKVESDKGSQVLKFIKD